MFHVEQIGDGAMNGAMKYIRADRKRVTIGIYTVVEESPNMTCIYADYGTRLVTSRKKWNQATKLAILMNDAYKEGYQSGKELYE